MKRIPAGELSIDERVQRQKLDEQRVNEIALKFNPRYLDTLTVSEREDSSKVIVNGWHRYEATLRSQGNSYRLPCVVHTGLSLEEEAELFIGTNYQKPPKRLDLHKTGVTAGHTMSVTIDHIADKYDWKIGVGKRGCISAVDSLESVYLHGEQFRDGFGPNAIDRTLHVIAEAWGNENPDAVKGSIIKALGYYLVAVQGWMDDVKNSKSDRDFDYEALSAALGTFKQSAKGFWQTARGKKAGSSDSLHVVLFESLYYLYNGTKHRNGPKLPYTIRDQGRPRKRQKTKGDTTSLPLFSG